MCFAKQEATLQKWGNGLGLRITKPLSQLAHFKAGTVVSTEAQIFGYFVGLPRNTI
jgi:antitoxin component of MazEF toxin-antitoxin module